MAISDPWPPPSTPPFPGVSCLLIRKVNKPNELMWYPTLTDLAHLCADRTVARVDFPLGGDHGDF